MLTIGRSDLQQLLSSCPGLKLIEVLPAASYAEYHLRGAVNIPLNEHFEEQIQVHCPEKSQSLIVYGLNFECKASLQAVERLNALGYQHIYHYEPGKVDWKAANLPVDQGSATPLSLEKHQGFLFSLTMTQFPLLDALTM